MWELLLRNILLESLNILYNILTNFFHYSLILIFYSKFINSQFIKLVLITNFL